jgi:thiamine-monophosphate kinase
MGKLSEDKLIGIIGRVVRPRGNVRVGIGDDACVLKDGTVMTTDAYADRVHFDLRYMTWEQVGARCACGAISDVVAMAAQPEVVLVALALPRGAEPGSVGQLYRGIESVCREMGCEVAGGDIIVTDRLSLALTVTGRTGAPVLRSGAKAGDLLYVTGTLGSAEAGRLILAGRRRGQRAERAERGGSVAPGAPPLPAWARPLVARHLRPIPRLAVMRALRGEMHSLIDTSDGLASDARHLCEMSQAKIVLEADALPILPGTARLCKERGLDVVDFVLRAGEDYELLFTGRTELGGNDCNGRLTPIGRVARGSGLWIKRSGRTLPVTARGYDHLRH